MVFHGPLFCFDTPCYGHLGVLVRQNTEVTVLHLAIRNKGTVDRRFLELAGLSKKKGKDVGKKGYKGSGTKMAAIAAARSGLRTAISSSDAKGRYFLFVTANPLVIEDGETVTKTSRVEYHYWRLEGDKAVQDLVYETDFVTDGFEDWSSPIGNDGNPVFKIVREHFCNGFDADQDFTLEVFEAAPSLLFAPPGETVVYIEYTEQVRAIVEDLVRYFKFPHADGPIAAVENVGEVWPKSDPNTTRLFIRGVLVACRNEPTHATLFDYSLENRDLLSEDRVPKSEDAYAKHLAHFLLRLRDESFVDYLLEQMREGRAQFELTALASIVPYGGKVSQESKDFWLGAVRRVFGERVVVPSFTAEYSNLEAEQMRKYVIVGRANPDLCKVLRMLGVPSADAVVPKSFDERIEQVRFDAMPQSSRETFYRAFALFAKYFPTYAKDYAVAFFRAKREKDEVIANIAGFAGSAEGAYKEIWLKVDQKGRLPDEADVLETLVHEARHCVSQAHDHERKFVDVADTDIVKIIYRNEGKVLYRGLREVGSWGNPNSEPLFVGQPRLPPLQQSDPHDTLELDLDGVIFLPEKDEDGKIR